MEFEFTSTLEKFPGNLWGLHVKVPTTVSAAMLNTGNKRWKAMINQTEEIRCAMMPSQSGYFININQKIAKKLGAAIGDNLKFRMTPDHSEYGMEMPEELQVMFDQEPSAFEFFQQLTPGKQRNLIYLVNNVKNTDSRIRKSLAIVTHLKEEKGTLDFKKLNQLIKYYNNHF